MKIAISGSSGFVGTHLTHLFNSEGIEVVSIPRALLSNEEQLHALIRGCHAVINLSGATINCRWSKKNKQLITKSRIQTTRKLVAAINSLPSVEKPRLFISTSAVGIYASHGKHSDNSQNYGGGFLSLVCKHWEAEAHQIDPSVRLVITRFGVVLDKTQGALPLMLLPFRLGVGGKITSGTQYLSWIHIDDLLQAFLFIISHQELSGTVNFTAPYPVTNSRFSKIAATVLHRPDWITVPAWALGLLYGEGHKLMTEGQCAYPTRLINAGFTFRFPTLTKALRDLLS